MAYSQSHLKLMEKFEDNLHKTMSVLNKYHEKVKTERVTEAERCMKRRRSTEIERRSCEDQRGVVAGRTGAEEGAAGVAAEREGRGRRSGTIRTILMPSKSSFPGESSSEVDRGQKGGQDETEESDEKERQRTFHWTMGRRWSCTS
jgi:hypothetical protein